MACEKCGKLFVIEISHPSFPPLPRTLSPEIYRANYLPLLCVHARGGKTSKTLLYEQYQRWNPYSNFCGCQYRIWKALVPWKTGNAKRGEQPWLGRLRKQKVFDYRKSPVRSNFKTRRRKEKLAETPRKGKDIRRSPISFASGRKNRE